MRVFTLSAFMLRAAFAFAAVTMVHASFLVLASRAQTIAYDDTTTFAGSGATNGGVTAAAGTTRYTFLVADDLAYSTAFAGQSVSQFKFTIANFNAASASANEGVTFWNSDGTNGGPGTVLFSISFNPVTVTSNNVSTLTYNLPVAQRFTLPTSGTIWAGEYFSGSTQTAATLNNFGQGLFNPPSVGSSLDRAFYSSTTGPFTTSNPSGSITTTPYTGLAANFGWQITVVPEPSTFLLAGMGGISLLLGANRLRRRG